MSSNLRAQRLDIRLCATVKRLLQAAAQSRHQTLVQPAIGSEYRRVRFFISKKPLNTDNDRIPSGD
jgi:uncharacterized protein (DUF1778 family)